MLSNVLQNWPFDDERVVGLFDTNEQMVTRLNGKLLGYGTIEKGRHTAKQVST